MNGGARIGFWTCTALVVGNVIGLGIFILPASLAPYGLNAMLGWLVTLVGCLALARVFAHLSHALPGADGPIRAWSNPAPELDCAPATAALEARIVLGWPLLASLAQDPHDEQESQA